MNEVAITGVGVISPIGNSFEEFTTGLREGRCGISDIRGRRVPVDFPITFGGMIEDSELNLSPVDSMSIQEESNLMLSHLVNQTLKDVTSNTYIELAIIGANDHGVDWGDAIDVYGGRYSAEDWVNRKSQTTSYNLERILINRGQIKNSKFESIGLYNTCITGNSALGTAYRKIKNGEVSRVLVVALEHRIRSWVLMPFHLLGALSTSSIKELASCPFSKLRNGFVKGEGGGMVLLESRAKAEERDAHVLGYLRGFSQTNDGWHMTDSRPDLKAAVKAVQMAMDDAGLPYNSLDYINAHGTSTLLNDLNETNTIKAAFGKKAMKIPISSTKSQIGHLNVSCGMVEAIASLAMLNKNFIAPTINLNEEDVECDLDYVPNKMREAELNFALSNSFGFGGHNSSLIIEGF